MERHKKNCRHRAKMKNGERNLHFAFLFQLQILAFVQGRERVNIAVNKPATQSSTFPYKKYQTPGKAGLAVDGKASDNFADRSCTHTDAGKQGRVVWWEVDLKKQYRIDNIRILNRAGDCGNGQECAVRLHDVRVDVHEVNRRLRKGRRGKYCNTHLGRAGPGWLNMTCTSPVTGRYVRISKRQITFHDVLSLCEVEIYEAADIITCHHFARMSVTQMLPRGGRMTARSNLHCGVICVRATECTGFGLTAGEDGNNQCYIFSQRLNKEENSSGDTVTFYFKL